MNARAPLTMIDSFIGPSYQDSKTQCNFYEIESKKERNNDKPISPLFSG